MLLSCSSKPNVLLASQPIEQIKLPELPDPYPPIESILLVPCYDDLMPTEPNSTVTSDLIKNDTDNHVKYNQCYYRQLKLIYEVLIREMDK